MKTKRKAKPSLCSLIVCAAIAAPVLGGPVDPNATAETKALFNNLMRIQQSEAVVFGQYRATYEGAKSNNDILDMTGDLPGMTEWHLPYIFGKPYHKKIARIRKDYENGLLTSLFWRMNNPFTGNGASDTTDGNGEKLTPAKISTLLPGQPEHWRYRKQLDSFGELMNDFPKINGKPAPVVLRFLPEMGGGADRWYKRTYCGSELYKKLWIAAYEYLVEEKGCHNILWCYNPNNTQSAGSEPKGYREFYAGIDYVDICGRNTIDADYPMGPGSMDSMRHAIQVAEEDNKLVCIAQQLSFRKNGDFNGNGSIEAGEHGSIPEWWTKVWLDRIQNKDRLLNKIAFVCAWKNESTSNYFLPYKGHVQEKNFVYMCSKHQIILQPDIPDLYAEPAGVENK